MSTVYWLLLLSALAGSSAQETLPPAGHKHRPVPGSSNNISKNDPGVQNAVLVATYTFNNESNDIFFFRVYAIKVAQMQIVKGIKYILEVTISRTICRKSMSPPSLDKCPFQPEGALQQMFNCHFEVWAIPWKHWSKVTSFVCHPPGRLLPTGNEGSTLSSGAPTQTHSVLKLMQ